MDGAVAVVLAAGRSTRMKSVLPKVLHEVSGRPLIEFVLDAVNSAGVSRTIVIVGHEADRVRKALSGRPNVEFALQAEQKGTGHAVMMCRDALASHRGVVLVLMGDAPLIRAESLSGLISDLATNNAACVIGTAETENNFGFGRIVRDRQGNFLRIVEQKDATPEEAAIREINVGCYAFDGAALFSALDRVKPANQQGEYYLTDVCEILRTDGRTVMAAKRLTITEALGVNTRAQLVDVHRVLHQRHCEKLMAEGVTLVDPLQISIDVRATIGPDTVIHPFTAIIGTAVIGKGCRIGPHAVVDSAVIPDGTIVGPFERRR
jgi:bifunctional UDP-N-acetylglucosamine pyrophosphorylase / glucosamine-1-phosphate N-acetyltransferase